MRGGCYASRVQIDVAASVQPFTALCRLSLRPHQGVTPACIAALSALQHLTSLSTNVGIPTTSQAPIDLAEYAHFTGVLSGPQKNCLRVYLFCALPGCGSGKSLIDA